MPIQNFYLANQEHSAKLVKISPMEKELSYEIDFQLPAAASMIEVSAKLDTFLRSDCVRKTLDTLKKSYDIHIRVLHPVDMSVKFQSV